VVRGINPDIDLVFTLAMAKDPNKRYRSAGEFAADLRLAREGRLPELVRARATKMLPSTVGTLDTLTSSS
jgi:hypothetical protein